MQDLEQTALVPAWLKVCCPNVTSQEVRGCTLTPHVLAQPSPPAAAASSSVQDTAGEGPTPLTCQHLRRINMGGLWVGGGGNGEQHQQQQHIRQQLAALPSLTSLATAHYEWLREPAMVSATITSLAVGSWDGAQPSSHLAAQFPNLRQLDAGSLTLDDAALEALLRLPHLERDFSLQRSHAHRAWRRPVHLCVDELDVGAFARLPLDGVQAVSMRGLVQTVVPSSDAQAVARVAEAVRRWGGLAMERRTYMCAQGEDQAALVATLGPLLAALPAAQRSAVGIMSMAGASAATVQALGRQLPDDVGMLQLLICTLQPDAWPALLRSLPAGVARVELVCTPSRRRAAARHVRGGGAPCGAGRHGRPLRRGYVRACAGAASGAVWRGGRRDADVESTVRDGLLAAWVPSLPPC